MVVLVLIGSLGCRPGPLDEGTSSADSSGSCKQLEINGTCFTLVDLGTAGGVQLAVDLDVDGAVELLLRVDASLVRLDAGPDGGPPAITETDGSPGWMTAGDLTTHPGLEVVVSGDSSTAILGATDDGFATLSSVEGVLGPLGAVELAGTDGQTWIVHAIPEFAAIAFDGESWTQPLQNFTPPGCGTNRSAVAGDYNGDGKQDAAFMGVVGSCDTHPDPEAPTPLALLWSTSPSEISQVERSTSATLDRGNSGDIDGDGIDDFLAWRSGYHTAAVLTGHAEEPLAERLEITVDGQVIGLADLSGDGRDQILFWRNSKVYELVDPVDASSERFLFDSGDHNLVFADLNGDNVDDFIQESNTQLTIFLSQAN